MRFALVNDVKSETLPGLIGRCPGCEQPMIAKCGTQRVWHWAHRGDRNCDPWWEPETTWHRGWKDQFPVGWQEIVQRDDSGEKHIADVKTEYGLVIEFQHSHLPAQEMAAREAFHRNMVWIVDGARLKRDRSRFLQGRRLFKPIPRTGIFITPSPEASFPVAWVNCTAPVFFDFEGVAATSEPSGPNRTLWCLLPERVEGHAIVAAVPPGAFINAARKRAQIFPSQTILGMVASRLRNERVLEASRWTYAPPPRRGRPFRRRRRMRDT
ncbi:MULTISPECIES: competence protein CoiA family protein [unclassified Mesorhizobium]|uniref:competence protein CoiA n=1 Tax=unclassified Mesorhizobium TaxID=325217 RepID=UPI002484C997|nr:MULTISPECIES: competence protein CoiA family protein [unclassified Mesorhizobium]